MSSNDIIEAPIGNYYGTPYAYEKDGKFFIGLEDYSGSSEEEISEAFYQAWVKEFGEKKDQ